MREALTIFKQTLAFVFKTALEAVAVANFLKIQKHHAAWGDKSIFYIFS
jgi:hypothetical protein